ncbi:mitochondrial glycine transporter B-like [Babylonia areolata]|uniref:mitochondrial glycine transporter B-like n=1 Tax=Babylonia areolata TaxID=304850 RepID=UPI003FD53A2C
MHAQEVSSTPASNPVQRLLKEKMDVALSSPVMKSFLAGALSGSLSTLLLQPLDLVKTRLQSPVYIGTNTGMMHVVINVVRQEKFLALWNGVWPSLMRCAPGVGLYFGTLHYLRSNFGSLNPKALESLCMGMTARSIAGVLMLPITVIKTRYESGAFKYRGLTSALVVTYKAEGFRGLYSGLAPTLLRDVPFSGIYLMFYTRLQLYTKPSMVGGGMEPLVDFCNGVMAGALASIVTQPADVIKTNIQLHPKKHRHLKQVLIYIYQKRGLGGFWRGIVPRTLRRTVMTAMAWTVFEEIMRRCKLK